METKKTLTALVITLAFLSCASRAEQQQHEDAPKLLSTLQQEQSEPFSYLARAVDQLGFKDSPEATAVTDGGKFSNTFNAIQFLYGEQLRPANKRVVTLEKDYLPIIHYSLTDNDLVYRLEGFSAPEDFDPSNNLISYIRWEVVNTGTEKSTGTLGLSLEKGALHNVYCTPWYRDRFMDTQRYTPDSMPSISKGRLTKGGHLVLLYPPEGAKQIAGETASGNKTVWSFDLQPGEVRTFVFKFPFVPVNLEHQDQIQQLASADYDALKKRVIQFWEKELDDIATFSVPEQKVQNAFRASYINLLIARDVLEDGQRVTQRDSEFQYDYFYVRSAAYFVRLYNMLGKPDIARQIANHFFIRDTEGKLLEFRSRLGIHNKYVNDYWGQVLWGIGNHIRHTGDPELLNLVFSGQGYGTGWSLINNHISEFQRAVAKDPLKIWPVAWPYDNEHIDGHYTGHSFWALLGLEYAVFMAEEKGDNVSAKKWQAIYDQYKIDFMKRVEEITALTGGYLPPGLDDPFDGYEWANSSAGLYPFEAIDKNHPAVRATLETVRKYNYQEGVATYSGSNALVAKNNILAGKPTSPERRIHHYETFYVTDSNLIIGEQQKVIEDLYSILVHTSSTHGGFEWQAVPWENRSVGNNRPPHIWMAQRYMELIRNMLVREEGSDVHLFSAISPEWAKPGEKVKVRNAPTYFGDVSYTASFDTGKMRVSLDNQWRDNFTGKVYFHIPWFFEGVKISLDGKFVATDTMIEIHPNTRKIAISWDEINAPVLHYKEAVRLYLDKYYNRPATASYSHLFPTLLAPQRLQTDDDRLITLFSPDNYAPIYYTTDGSQPSARSARYNGPIGGDVETLKAVCIDEHGAMSDVLTLKPGTAAH